MTPDHSIHAIRGVVRWTRPARRRRLRAVIIPVPGGVAHGRESQDRSRAVHPDRRSPAPHHPGRRHPGGGRPHHPGRQGGRAGRRAGGPRHRRSPPRDHPRLLQRAHAHQLRASGARHLSRRAGEPAAPRLQSAVGDDRGRGVPRHPARPGRAGPQRDGVLPRPREHAVPRRVPAGLRGRGDPRRAGRGGHRSGGAVEAPALPGPGGGGPHHVVHREVERSARRADPGVGDAVLVRDVQRGPPAVTQAGGGRAGDRTHPPPQQRDQGARGRGGPLRAQPDRLPPVHRGAGAERAAGALPGTRRGRDRRDRADRHRDRDVSGHRGQGRPRGATSMAACPSSSPAA